MTKCQTNNFKKDQNFHYDLTHCHESGHIDVTNHTHVHYSIASNHLVFPVSFFFFFFSVFDSDVEPHNVKQLSVILL